MVLNCGEARFSACLGAGSSGQAYVLTRTEASLEPIDRYPVAAPEASIARLCT